MSIHQGQAVLTAGCAPEKAAAALILIHGRGASAQGILALQEFLPHPEFAYFAPQAADMTWYPNRFTTPIASNEPGLSSALQVIEDVMAQTGLPPEKIILLGFSQGACLALEYAARHARRYGGIVGLSGGLIGEDGIARDYAGSLDGTPVFLGCSDVDFHIPLERVKESREILKKLGGNVTERIYPGMGHTIHEDELAFVRQLMAEATG